MTWIIIIRNVTLITKNVVLSVFRNHIFEDQNTFVSKICSGSYNKSNFQWNIISNLKLEDYCYMYRINCNIKTAPNALTDDLCAKISWQKMHRLLFNVFYLTTKMFSENLPVLHENIKKLAFHRYKACQYSDWIVSLCCNFLLLSL